MLAQPFITSINNWSTVLLRNAFIKNKVDVTDDTMKTLEVPIEENSTGDMFNVNNYQPIALAAIPSRVLDGVLDRVLDEHLVLNDAQFDFYNGLSIATIILCPKYTIQY